MKLNITRLKIGVKCNAAISLSVKKIMDAMTPNPLAQMRNEMLWLCSEHSFSSPLILPAHVTAVVF